MSDHLLPPNASPLERALSLSTDTLTRLAEPTEALRTFKVNPADPLLPWLIWEYGLGELLPYLPEPRRAIAEGILWQRLRGTPAALATALSWIGMRATVEQEPPGVHFAEFQLDPGQVLDSDTAIANLVAIARLSAPARSRLSRIYHGWDLRRIVLDESRLGEALLSDHSGVFWRDGQTKLSFGRVHPLAQSWPAATLAAVYAPARFAAARLIDRYLLDYARLGDPGHTPNEEILHSHLFSVVNALGVRVAQTLLPERKFCRAMVVPSDSTQLGDAQARTPRRGLWRVRDLPRLGAMTLGEGPEIVWRPIDAVVPRSHAVTAASSWQVASAPSLRRRHSRRASAPSAAGAASREALARAAAAWRGQTWTDAPWPAGSWRDVRELIQTHHFTS